MANVTNQEILNYVLSMKLDPNTDAVVRKIVENYNHIKDASKDFTNTQLVDVYKVIEAERNLGETEKRIFKEIESARSGMVKQALADNRTYIADLKASQREEANIRRETVRQAEQSFREYVARAGQAESQLTAINNRVIASQKRIASARADLAGFISGTRTVGTNAVPGAAPAITAAKAGFINVLEGAVIEQQAAERYISRADELRRRVAQAQETGADVIRHPATGRFIGVGDALLQADMLSATSLERMNAELDKTKTAYSQLLKDEKAINAEADKRIVNEERIRAIIRERSNIPGVMTAEEILAAPGPGGTPLSAEEAYQVGVRSAQLQKERRDRLMEIGNNVGNAATWGVTAPIIAAGAFSLNEYVKRNQAFTQVRSFLDPHTVTPGTIGMLSGALNSMAVNPLVGLDYEEAARLMQRFQHMGVAPQYLQEHVEHAAYLQQVIPEESIDNVLSNLMQISNARRMNPADFGKLTAALAQSRFYGAAQTGQLLRGMTYGGQAAEASGMSIPQEMSLMSVLISSGVRPQVAGTATQRIIKDIMDAVSQGGNKLENFAKLLHVSGDEFKKMFNHDAFGVVVKLGQAFSGLSKTDLNKTLEDLHMGEIRVWQAGSALAKGWADLEPRAKAIGDAYKEQTADMKAAEIQSQSLQRQFQQMQREIKASAATIGEDLMPTVLSFMRDGAVPLANGIRALTEDYHNLSDVAKQTWGQVLIGVAAFGPTLIGLTSIAKSIEALDGAMAASAGIPALTASLTALKSLGQIAIPIVISIAVVEATAGAIDIIDTISGGGLHKFLKDYTNGHITSVTESINKAPQVIGSMISDARTDRTIHLGSQGAIDTLHGVIKQYPELLGAGPPSPGATPLRERLDFWNIVQGNDTLRQLLTDEGLIGESGHPNFTGFNTPREFIQEALKRASNIGGSAWERYKQTPAYRSGWHPPMVAPGHAAGTSPGHSPTVSDTLVAQKKRTAKSAAKRALTAATRAKNLAQSLKEGSDTVQAALQRCLTEAQFAAQASDECQRSNGSEALDFAERAVKHADAAQAAEEEVAKGVREAKEARATGLDIDKAKAIADSAQRGVGSGEDQIHQALVAYKTLGVGEENLAKQHSERTEARRHIMELFTQQHDRAYAAAAAQYNLDVKRDPHHTAAAAARRKKAEDAADAAFLGYHERLALAAGAYDKHEEKARDARAKEAKKDADKAKDDEIKRSAALLKYQHGDIDSLKYLMESSASPVEREQYLGMIRDRQNELAGQSLDEFSRIIGFSVANKNWDKRPMNLADASKAMAAYKGDHFEQAMSALTQYRSGLTSAGRDYAQGIAGIRLDQATRATYGVATGQMMPSQANLNWMAAFANARDSDKANVVREQVRASEAAYKQPGSKMSHEDLVNNLKLALQEARQIGDQALVGEVQGRLTELSRGFKTIARQFGDELADSVSSTLAHATAQALETALESTFSRRKEGRGKAWTNLGHETVSGLMNDVTGAVQKQIQGGLSNALHRGYLDPKRLIDGMQHAGTEAMKAMGKLAPNVGTEIGLAAVDAMLIATRKGKHRTGAIIGEVIGGIGGAIIGHSPQGAEAGAALGGLLGGSFAAGGRAEPFKIHSFGEGGMPEIGMPEAALHVFSARDSKGMIAELKRSNDRRADFGAGIMHLSQINVNGDYNEATDMPRIKRNIEARDQKQQFVK